MALKLGIQTYQILTNDDEVCIPSLSSILLAVPVGRLNEKNAPPEKISTQCKTSKS